jgi:hypothetical protein
MLVEQLQSDTHRRSTCYRSSLPLLCLLDSMQHQRKNCADVSRHLHTTLDLGMSRCPGLDVVKAIRQKAANRSNSSYSVIVIGASLNTRDQHFL